MKISYLGISERNCNQENKQRFAQIECNNKECNALVEALNKENWEHDVFGEGVDENTIYVPVTDREDFEYFKNWYKEAKKRIKR